jgi:hypothetical protein
MTVYDTQIITVFKRGFVHVTLMNRELAPLNICNKNLNIELDKATAKSDDNVEVKINK